MHISMDSTFKKRRYLSMLNSNTSHHDTYEQVKNVLKNKCETPTQVIAVTGGKGGIGKTHISVNLSIALSHLNKKVLLLDGDLGLSNIDVLLNIHVDKTLNHVIYHNASLSEIMVDGPGGIKVIPSSSGAKELANLSTLEYTGLIRAFDELETNFDYLIIDTASGISNDIIMFSKAANEVLIIVCDEPTSITDAYALIKVLNKEQKEIRFHILPNMVETYTDGHALFNKLNKSTERFLNVSLNLCGIILYDELFKKSVKKQKALIEEYPNSGSANSLKRIANMINKWIVTENTRDIHFFCGKMLAYHQNIKDYSND
jgi:flagellar biosynthesis protein FlhG